MNQLARTLLEGNGPPPMGTRPFTPWGEGDSRHVLEDITFPGPGGRTLQVDRVVLSVNSGSVVGHRASVGSGGVSGEDRYGSEADGILEIDGVYDMSGDVEEPVPVTDEIAQALWSHVEGMNLFRDEPLRSQQHNDQY